MSLSRVNLTTEQYVSIRLCDTIGKTMTKTY